MEVSEETNELISFALDMAEDTDGALEPTIYPVLRVWGFTGEENRIPSETEIQQLLQKVGYEKVEMDENCVRLDADMMLDLGAVGKGYAGDVAADLLRENGITSGNYERYFVGEDGKIYLTEGVEDRFSFDDNHANMQISVIEK